MPENPDVPAMSFRAPSALNFAATEYVHADRLDQLSVSTSPPQSACAYSLEPPAPDLPAPIVLSDCDSLQTGYRYRYKRWIDVIGASILFAVLAPLMLALLIAVRLDGGPTFFGSPRLGHGGRVFRAWKFRTMVPDADRLLVDLLALDIARRREWDEHFKLSDDPRVTRIGRFLRRTSLDELPQLWNVLRGEMSFVGPRPILLDEVPTYGHALHYYVQVRPGLTGLWQVTGRDALNYRRRIELNNWYVRNLSLRLDIFVLLRTVRVVASRVGAS